MKPKNAAEFNSRISIFIARFAWSHKHKEILQRAPTPLPNYKDKPPGHATHKLQIDATESLTGRSITLFL